MRPEVISLDESRKMPMTAYSVTGLSTLVCTMCSSASYCFPSIKCSAGECRWN